MPRRASLTVTILMLVGIPVRSCLAGAAATERDVPERAGAIQSRPAAPAPILRSDVYIGGRDGYHTYRIPAIVVTKTGRVLAFCEGRKNGPQDDGDIDLLLKRSSDDGRTWSEQAIVHEEGGDAPITIGNPCPIVDAQDAVHLLFTRDNERLFYTRSSDAGRTWSTPREETATLDDFDYARVRVGTGPGHGIDLRSGRLVVPIWMCDRERRDRDVAPTADRYVAGVIFSDDRGGTWRSGGLVPSALGRLNECTVVETSPGRLLLNIRGHDPGFRAVSESTDAGETWSSPRLDRTLPCPTCQASMLRLSGNEAIFANPAAATRSNLTVRLSRDGGRTWPHSFVLNPGPSGYSDLAVTRHGRILCLFECGEKVYNEKIAIARFRPEILEQTNSAPG